MKAPKRLVFEFNGKSWVWSRPKGWKGQPPEATEKVIAELNSALAAGHSIKFVGPASFFRG